MHPYVSHYQSTTSMEERRRESATRHRISRPAGSRLQFDIQLLPKRLSRQPRMRPSFTR